MEKGELGRETEGNSLGQKWMAEKGGTQGRWGWGNKGISDLSLRAEVREMEGEDWSPGGCREY